MKHFEGKLGVDGLWNSFDYDETEFAIMNMPYSYYDLGVPKVTSLVYIGEEEKPIVLPEGCNCCDYMFYDHLFKKPDSLKDLNTLNVKSMAYMFSHCTFKKATILNFNTSNVENMSFMFQLSEFAKGSSLGDNFNTLNVKNMNSMFNNCKLPVGFSLGGNFNTSNVEDMGYIFSYCSLPKGFSLGNKFYTKNVRNMRNMLSDCKLPEGFTLGRFFDTFNVKDMGGMFANCVMSEGFTLGNKFDTSNVEVMNSMFANCVFPSGFSLGNLFNTVNVKNMWDMFCWVHFPKGFTLGDNFNTRSVEVMDSMFRACVFPKGFTSLGGNFYTSGVIHMTRMFSDSKFMDMFSLGDKFIVSSDTITDEMFFACVFKKGIDLGNHFQPDCFTSIFEKSNLPDDVLKLPNNEVVDYLNNKVKETNRRVVSDCKKEIVAHLKDGVSIDKTVALVSKGKNVDLELVCEAKKEVLDTLSKKCLVAVDSIMSMEGGRSKYTVGQAKEKLISKKYPEEVVNEVLINYLRDQYLYK